MGCNYLNSKIEGVYFLKQLRIDSCSVIKTAGSDYFNREPTHGRSGQPIGLYDIKSAMTSSNRVESDWTGMLTRG